MQIIKLEDSIFISETSWIMVLFRKLYSIHNFQYFRVTNKRRGKEWKNVRKCWQRKTDSHVLRPSIRPKYLLNLAIKNSSKLSTIQYGIHESSYGGLVLWPGHLRQCCCFPAQRALISKFYLLYTPYITNSLSSSAGL